MHGCIKLLSDQNYIIFIVSIKNSEWSNSLMIPNKKQIVSQPLVICDKIKSVLLVFQFVTILLINVPTIKYTFCYGEELHKMNLLTCRVKVYLLQWELCLSPHVKSWLKRNKPVKTRSMNPPLSEICHNIIIENITLQGMLLTFLLCFILFSHLL